MRLQRGTLKQIHKITGIPTSNLSDYIAARRFPSRSRAIELGKACAKLGLPVSKEIWMFGTTKQIKAALTTSMKPDCSTTKKQMELF